jgi:hypothetical protein
MAVDPSLRMVGELAESFDLLFVLVLPAGTGVTLGRAIRSPARPRSARGQPHAGIMMP